MPLKICLTKENTDTCGYRCFCQFPFFGRAVPADNLGTDSRAFIVTHPVSPDPLRSLPIPVCRGDALPFGEGGRAVARSGEVQENLSISHYIAANSETFSTSSVTPVGVPPSPIGGRFYTIYIVFRNRECMRGRRLRPPGQILPVRSDTSRKAPRRIRRR